MNKEQAGLTDEIRRRVEQLGFEVADLRRKGSRQRPLLQIRIDRSDSEPGHGVTVADCATVSRGLEEWLDESGILGSKYILEVSSPGIERPVRWPEHWRRFQGRAVNVRLPERGRIRATIVDVTEDARVVLNLAGSEEEITVLIEDRLDATLAVDWT